MADHFISQMILLGHLKALQHNGWKYIYQVIPSMLVQFNQKEFLNSMYKNSLQTFLPIKALIKMNKQLLLDNQEDILQLTYNDIIYDIGVYNDSKFTLNIITNNNWTEPNKIQKFKSLILAIKYVEKIIDIKINDIDLKK